MKSWVHFLFSCTRLGAALSGSGSIQERQHLGFMDLVGLWGFGLAWIAELLVVNGCLVACYSSDLLSVEGLVIRYKSYLRCIRLRGHSWESAGLVQWDGLL